MALTEEEKMEIMKEAYANNYDGKFTDLFKQAEAAQAQGVDPNAPHNQEYENAPTQPVPPTDPVLNPTPVGMGKAGDELVESFQSADPNQIPTGERVRDVLNPGEYRKGGTRIVESLPSYKEGMGAHVSDYIAGYRRKK